MTRLAIAAVLMLIAGPGRATERPPLFNSVDVCEMEIGGKYPDSAAVSSCVGLERHDLHDLIVIYSAVPAALRTECEQASRKYTRGMGSYAFLRQCIKLRSRP